MISPACRIVPSGPPPVRSSRRPRSTSRSWDRRPSSTHPLVRGRQPAIVSGTRAGTGSTPRVLLCRRRSVKPSLDGAGQVFVGPGAVGPPAVEEECRRAVDAAAPTPEKVAADLRQIFPVHQCFAQTVLGKPQGLGECEQQGHAEALLVLR